jgi:hypothetical protein
MIALGSIFMLTAVKDHISRCKQAMIDLLRVVALAFQAQACLELG